MAIKKYKLLAFSSLVIAFSSASAVFGATASSGGQQSQRGAWHHGPCANDIQKFCHNTEPGGGRVAECLKQHENELSNACKDQRQKIASQINEIHEACKNDLDKFCSGMQPGEGRLIGCLKQHKNELSQSCRDETLKVKRKAKKRHHRQHYND